MSIDRRRFLQRAQGAALGACVLGALPAFAVGCASLPYVRGEVRDGLLRIPVDALDADGRALVEAPALDLPVFVRRVPGEAPVALSTRCMHRGCEVEPATDRLVCPCHGSEYDLRGAVLQGPTQLPLEGFVVREVDGLLVIDLATRGRA